MKYAIVSVRGLEEAERAPARARAGVTVVPVRASRVRRGAAATACIARCSSRQPSRSVTRALNPSGALAIDGAMSGGAISQSTRGDVHRTCAASRAPVGLVDLLLDPLALEAAVGERVHGVDVHVVLGEELPEPRALLRALHQRARGGGRQAQADAEGLVGRDARLDGGQVGLEARPHLLPGVPGMDERRVRQVILADSHVPPFALGCRLTPRARPLRRRSIARSPP